MEINGVVSDSFLFVVFFMKFIDGVMFVKCFYFDSEEGIVKKVKMIVVGVDEEGDIVIVDDVFLDVGGSSSGGVIVIDD